VAIGPFEGFSVLIVMTNVPHELASKIGFGGEDASGDDIALDLREPDFDLVEPGGIGRSKVQMHPRMSGQEGADPLGFVRREVVDNEVDVTFWRGVRYEIFEEGDKLGAGMPAGSLAMYLARGGFQGGVERKGSMAIILEAVALGASGRERQHRIESVEGLNGALLIDTENHGVSGWFEIETDDIGRLGLEVGIVADQIPAQPMWLQTGFGPDAHHARLVDAQLQRQFATAPMRGTVRGLAMQGPINDAGFDQRRVLGGSATGMPAEEAAQALLHETISPQADRVDADLQPPTQCADAFSSGQTKHNPSTATFLRSNFAAAAQHLELSSFGWTKDKGRFHPAILPTSVSELNVSVH
jgi:hypothetical protein